MLACKPEAHRAVSIEEKRMDMFIWVASLATIGALYLALVWLVSEPD